MHMPIQDNVYLMKWNSSLGAYQLQIFVMAKSYMNGRRFVKSRSKFGLTMKSLIWSKVHSTLLP